MQTGGEVDADFTAGTVEHVGKPALFPLLPPEGLAILEGGGLSLHVRKVQLV